MKGGGASHLPPHAVCASPGHCELWQSALWMLVESLLSGAAGTRCRCETTTRYNDAPQMITYAFRTVLFLVLCGFTLVRYTRQAAVVNNLHFALSSYRILFGDIAYRVCSLSKITPGTTLDCNNLIRNTK